MKRLLEALKIFFKIVFRKEFYKKIKDCLESRVLETKKDESAVMLLAALQREARFIDFIMESLDSYPDSQVGAAIREIHRDSKKLLNRFFHIEPLSSEIEGSEIQIPSQYNPAEYHFIGSPSTELPKKGILRHHGWKITSCNIPEWKGEDKDLYTLTPLEVEIRKEQS